MTENQVRRFSDYAATLGESPVWDDRGERLFWVDIEAGLILARSDKTEMHWQLPERVGSIGLTTNPEVCVVALERGFGFFDLSNDRFKRIDMPEQLGPELRFNDGKCDPYGGFIAGTMSEALPRRADGALYRLSPDLSITQLKHKIGVSNGLAFNTGGRMFFADSFVRKIWTYSFSGSYISDEIEFVASDAFLGVPDGAETDVHDRLWSAEWDGSRLGVYDPSGGKPTYIQLPVLRPTSCCFGGPELSTLYITTAQAEVETDPLAGHVLEIENAGHGRMAHRFRLEGAFP